MSVSKYRIDVWGDDEFALGEGTWNAVLDRSRCDRLFMSWAWLRLWWAVHREPFELELLIVVVYENDNPVAIAPFSLRAVSHKKMFSTRRLECLGHLWREPDTVISEFVDIIVDDTKRCDVIPRIADFLTSQVRFDELVAGNVSETSDIKELVSQTLPKRCAVYVRESDRMETHTVDLTPGFPAYVAKLTGDSRRKIYTLRRRLENASIVLVTRNDVEQAFNLMDDYLCRRWGTPMYSGKMKLFHVEFARQMADKGRLRLTMLEDGGRPISIMYNVRAGNEEYNLQSAFHPESRKGITPTYLHFGYCAEQACENRIEKLHLLAGKGKNRNYKRDLAPGNGHISSFQLLRGIIPKLIYGSYDAVFR